MLEAAVGWGLPEPSINRVMHRAFEFSVLQHRGN